MTSFADPGSYSPQGDNTRNVTVKLDADVSGYSQQIGSAQQSTAQMNQSVLQLSGSLHRLSQWGGKKLVHFAAADFAGLGVAVADAASLEHQLGTLRATSVVTGTSIDAMKSQLDDAFGRFPVARRDVIQLAETINNLGVNAPKAVGSMLATFTKLGAATGESPIALAAGNIQLDRMMGTTSPKQVANYANSLLVVSKNQNVAASGVTDFAQSIAPMSRAAGIGEAAVLGISAAFAKAGVDGGFAANTFSKIVGDITRLSQTGSPELAKYASFVGQTVEQFQKLSGTEKFTTLFNQIAKGGPQALSFMESIGSSQRDIRAIQGVTQSGSLSQAIAQAQGGSTNTDALDAASKAAFSGLTDSTLKLGNEFTKLGEMLGGPFLKILTPIVETFGKGLSLLNQVVAAMGPIPGYVAALAGVLAAPAGIALGHLGVISGLALGRTMLGPRSSLRAATRAGRIAGTAMAGGMTEAEALQLTPIGQRIAAGRDPLNPMTAAPWRLSAPYSMAATAAQRGPGPIGTAMGWMGRGARATGTGLMGVGTWVMNDQGRYQRDSYADTLNRSGNVPRTMPTLRESMRAGSVGGMWRSFREMLGSGVYAMGSMASSGVGGTTRAAAAALREAAEREAAAAAAAGTPKWSTRMGMRRPVAPLATALETGAAVGGAAARAGGAAWRGISAVGGAVFTPVGMLATMVGIPLVSKIVDAIKEGQAQKHDLTQVLSGSEQYDQLLGRTSTNLARFGSAVDVAADKLNKFAGTPLKDVTTVTAADRAAIQEPGFKITDPNLQGLIQNAAEQAQAPGGDKDAVSKTAMAWLSKQGLSAGDVNGELGTKLKQDLLSAMTTTAGGVDQGAAAGSIMNAFANQPGGPAGGVPDLNFIASMAGRTGGNVEGFKTFMGLGAQALSSGTQNASPEEARKAQVINALSMGAQATGNADMGQEARIASLADFFKSQLSVDPKEFQTALANAGQQLGTEQYTTAATAGGPVQQRTAYGTTQQGYAALVEAYANTPQGQNFLQTTGMDKGQLLAAVQNPSPLPAATGGDTASLLAQKGSLGQYAAGNTSFLQAAIGGKSGQSGAGYAAAQDLLAEASKQTGGDLSAASNQLTRLADSMGGVSAPLIKTAADLARQQQSYQLPTLSREDQVRVAGQNAAASANAALEPNATPDTVAQAQADKNTAEQSKESYRQYMIGRIQQIEQYGVTQRRAIEDNNLNISRSERDFQEQMARSDYDNQLARQRNQEDFQKNSQRSLDDYHLNVARQNEDHARDLKRQAAAAAQDIYDPYARIQRKSTTDAGTLVMNLTEQNADLERQMRQLQELKDRGLSQGAIDTLKLSDVGNAQQVDTLLQSLQQDPSKMGQINDLVTKRLGDTTALTQSPFSVAFRQQDEDFSTSMKRASDDFEKGQQRAADDQSKALDRMATDIAATRQRAVADHNKALSDMAIDFKKAQDHAAEDLATSLKQYTGNFADIFSSLTTNSLGQLATYAPAASKIIIDELNKIKTSNPWLDPSTAQVTAGFVGGVSQELGHALGMQGYATGGISLTQQTARVSEQGPELHLPLNSRGENFMATIIAKSLARGVTTAISAAPDAGSSMTHDNSVSFAGADIKVVAQDPNAMAKALAGKAKLARLASPVRH